MIAAEAAAHRRRHRIQLILRLRAGEIVDGGVGGADRMRGGDGVHASLVARQVARVLTAHRESGDHGWIYPPVRVEVAPAAIGWGRVLSESDVARRAGALLGFGPYGKLPEVRIVENARVEAGFRVAAVEFPGRPRPASFWEMRTADATRQATPDERIVATLQGRTEVLAVPAEGLQLGRSPHGPGTVDDDRASRAHAMITTSGGRVTVTDLGSRNGTFVNEARVAATVLADGDTLRIGSTTFRVRLARHVPPPVRLPAPLPVEPATVRVQPPADDRAARVDALLDRWWAGESDPGMRVFRAMREIRRLVPSDQRGRQDAYLRSLSTGPDAVSVGALRRARQVRNAVAHPDDGPPSAADIVAATRTIRSFLLSLPADTCPLFRG